jgi:tRNA A-37 threonylcarbamoyl transferase component Bud32
MIQATQARAMMSDRQARQANNARVMRAYRTSEFDRAAIQAQAEHEADRIANETEAGMCVPLAWMNWDGRLRKRERLMLAESLRAFVAADDPAAYLSGRQR